MVRQTLTLTLLLAGIGAAQEYYISYTLASRDHMVVQESVKISRAMTPLRGKRVPLCTFETNASGFDSWAADNPIKLIQCLLSNSVSIRSYGRSDSMISQDNLDILTTECLPVQVEFNDGLVTIKKIQ